MPRIKSKEEIEVMAVAGAKLARIVERLRKEVSAGVRAGDLDSLAFKLIYESGSEPAFLNYHPLGSKRPFPATLCVSLNDVVVHGVPSRSRVIRPGDLVKLDLGLVYKGFYSDMALTVGVPPISFEIAELIGTTREALEKGITAAKPGATLGDVGAAISEKVRRKGFSVVEALCGHGIGRALHEEPSVLNFGIPGKGDTLREGMVLAIEPMVAAGSGAVILYEDDSYRTKDGSLSAHFEHTVAITARGARILTQA
ncbi:MAG: type I methionyl aminopeptidase [Candidatus Liptonbacteria bacterium]|nr:type I methionyl aminopeptidase [Candidatus Liptonbacteria bacterium]